MLTRAEGINRHEFHLKSVYAHSYSWYLWHFHGRSGRAGARSRAPGNRLRCWRLSADERPVARAGHRFDRRLWRRPAGAQTRHVRGGQRGQPQPPRRRHPEIPADGSHSGRRRALHQRPAMAGRARFARPPRSGRGRNPRQNHHNGHADLDSGKRRPATRVSSGRCAAEFRHLRAPGRPGGNGLCAGKGGARKAGGGHGAEPIAVPASPSS